MLDSDIYSQYLFTRTLHDFTSRIDRLAFTLPMEGSGSPLLGTE